MKDLYQIRDMLMDEVCEISEKPLSLDKIKLIDMLTHSIKSIDTVNAMRESGYSNTYGGGHSYGRMTDGRYSREGYPHVKDDIRERLERAMHEASTEREREAIRKCMDII